MEASSRSTFGIRRAAINRSLITVAAAVGLVVLVLAAPAAAATRFCSPSGDYCTSVQRRSGAVYLRIGTFSFRGRVRICVRHQTRICRSYPLRRSRHGLYEAKVRWYGSYPNQGPGAYRVEFFLGSTRLGPMLTFRI
jgi:hypothetical protein